uniref:glucose-6-phosphate 1-epimerase n=1 Tax=Chlamydomonas euryale TaxID=1486919 RepID=A0A7R9VDK3_9CHLO
MAGEATERIAIHSAKGAVVEVCRHGGHVVSWKNAAGEDLIFVSKQAIFKPPKAIRGGVPVCFPQFGMMGPMTTQHGFARNVAWEVLSAEGCQATLQLCYGGTSNADFPHPFELQTVIRVGDDAAGSFEQELKVTNTGTSPLTFTTALHTYYRVSSVADAHVSGLSGHRYLDNLKGQAEAVDHAEHVDFSGEVDRVYVAAPDSITITDGAAGRAFQITKHGFPDAVVWNPWIEKAASMADFGDEEYKDMLCIEPAVAGSGAVTLAPTETWSGCQSVLRVHVGEAGQAGAQA